MLIINGAKQEFNMAQFTNLEEVLVKFSADCESDRQIITDVFLNDQPFSEIYPHQAEDIETSEIEKLELISISHYKMGNLITEELFTVTKALKIGAEEISDNLRQGDDGKALEVLINLIDVTRDFTSMINILIDDFGIEHDIPLATLLGKFSILISDINIVIEDEDWVMLADLMEFEFYDLCNSWEVQLNELRKAFAEVVE